MLEPSDPFVAPQKKSGFLSFLDWIDRPGQVVRNLLRGNFGAAGRQGLDFFGDAIDAAIPFDAIPEATKPEDYVSGGELLGVKDPSLGKTALDVGVGMLTDPLSYLSFGAIPAAAKAARAAAVAGKVGVELETAARAAKLAAGKGVRLGIPFTSVSTPVIFGSKTLDPLAIVGEKLGQAKTLLPQGAQDKLDYAGRKIGEMFAAQQPTLASTRPAIDKGVAVEQGMAAAGGAEVHGIFQGKAEPARKALYRAITNIDEVEPGRYAQIADDAPLSAPYATGAIAKPEVPFSGTALPVTPGEHMMPLGKRTSRGPIDPLASDLGIHGVDVPGIRPDNLDAITKDPYRLWENVFAPKFADRAAAETMDVAFPRRALEQRFTSGMDEANRAMMYKQGIRPVPKAGAEGAIYSASDAAGGLLSPSQIESMAKERAEFPELIDPNPRRKTYLADDSLTPHVSTLGADPLAVRKELDIGDHVRAWPIDPVAKMLGTVGPEVPKAPEAAMARSVTDELNARLMGPAGVPRTPVPIAELPAVAATHDTIEGQLARIKSRLEAMPLDPKVREQAMQAYEKFAPYAARQWNEEKKIGVAFHEPGSDPTLVPRDYIARKWTGFLTDSDAAMRGGSDALKARSLVSGEDVAGQLNRNPNLKLEQDAVKAAMNRSNAHAQLGKTASIGKDLIDERLPIAKAKLEGNRNPYDDKLFPTHEGKLIKGEYGPAAIDDVDRAVLAAEGKTLADPEFSAATEKILGSLSHHPVDQQMLSDHIHGLDPRGPITGALAKLNKGFKQAVTFGLILPRLAFSVRNVVSGQGQVLANAEAAGQFGYMAKQMVPTIMGAVDDGIEKLFGRRLRPDTFNEYRQALKNGGGTREGVIAQLKTPRMREAYEHGVLENNFVTAEQMANDVERTGWRKLLGPWLDMPPAIAKGSEQRMRYALFDSLRVAGHSAEDAAKITRDTLFDYSHASTLNRGLRDWVPFGQWSAKAIPSQAKFLSKNPAAAVGFSGLYGQDRNEPVNPWLSEQARIGLGTNDRGNAEYLTGLGLPVETLNQIPNIFGASSLPALGRDLERTVVASTTPMVKGAYSTVSGRDPFFGSDSFGYSKVPVFGDLGEAGRIYNYVSDTGVTAPVDSALRVIDNIIDSRHTVPERALETLMGAKVSEVDPDVALQQQLTEFLDRNPDVASQRNLYSRSKDPETVALIRQLQAARKRIHDKRAKEPMP